MVRQARKISPTGYYHVMMRGINKERIFEKTGFKSYFYYLLRILCSENPIELVAYCIMNNHVHIILQGEIDILSMAIKKINIRFAMKYNKDNERVGHVFQDRYKSEIINDDNYLLQAIRYVHNNPVSAGLVGHAREYRWSSYKEYTSNHLKVINRNQKEFIMGYFSGSLENFIKFHLKYDSEVFLDTKEEMEKYKVEVAKRIKNDFKKSKGVTGSDFHLEDIKKLAKILLERSQLSHRQIAELIEVNVNTIHRISKETLQTNSVKSEI